MLHEATAGPRQEPRQEILRTAARLFQQQGYDATSMNDVAAALKLSKGGLYHHFQSKDEILFHIMSHALDVTEERVINVVRRIEGASVAGASIDVTEERLRTLIRLHIEVVLSPEDREIKVMLHENHPLPPTLGRKINGRKKDYVHFVEHIIADVQRKHDSPSQVTPRAAALALVGMINWIHQWYKPGGPLTGEEIARQYCEIFFRGAIGSGATG
ncbi:MAG: TetR/AcrR family transcriptional regulator [Terriglobales bacterium]